MNASKRTFKSSFPSVNKLCPRSVKRSLNDKRSIPKFKMSLKFGVLSLPTFTRSIYYQFIRSSDVLNHNLSLNPHNLRDVTYWGCRSQKPAATHFHYRRQWTNWRGVIRSCCLYFSLGRRVVSEGMGPCPFQGKAKVTPFIHFF